MIAKLPLDKMTSWSSISNFEFIFPLLTREFGIARSCVRSRDHIGDNVGDFPSSSQPPAWSCGSNAVYFCRNLLQPKFTLCRCIVPTFTWAFIIIRAQCLLSKVFHYKTYMDTLHICLLSLPVRDTSISLAIMLRFWSLSTQQPRRPNLTPSPKSGAQLRSMRFPCHVISRIVVKAIDYPPKYIRTGYALSIHKSFVFCARRDLYVIIVLET